MGRTREFDKDYVLDGAMMLFWSRGYEGTSTAYLVQELGIARASIYGAFGSKHQLYLAALDRYLEQRDPSVVELLSIPGPALPLVRMLVERYETELLQDSYSLGCFVVNAAVELAPSDDEVARRVRTSWDTIEVALTSALLRARAQGELPAGTDTRALARFLLVVLQGMRVMGRADGSGVRVADAARVTLEALGM